jgi:hypothetical protein
VSELEAGVGHRAEADGEGDERPGWVVPVVADDATLGAGGDRAAELGQTDVVADRESVWFDGCGGGGGECEHGVLRTIVRVGRIAIHRKARRPIPDLG